MAKTTKKRAAEEIQGEINALKQLLANSDYKAIKHSEGLIPDEEYEETRALRSEWRESVNRLEAELEGAE